MPIVRYVCLWIIATLVVGSFPVCAEGDKHKHEEHKENSKAPEDKQEKDPEHGEEHASEHKHGEEHEGEDEHGEEHEEAHEHGHGEGGGRNVGPGKAILKASKQDGIQLAEKAIATLKLKTVPISAELSPASVETSYSIPTSALVFSKTEVGVYRLRDANYKLIDVVVLSKTKDYAKVKTKELRAGDQVVTQGVPLLRVADLEAFGGSGDGHGH